MLSLLDYAAITSSVSVRCRQRWGNQITILGHANLGSAFSMRHSGALGSGLSTFARTNFGNLSELSILNNFHLGSSLSLRAVTRLGSNVSIFSRSTCSSSLSLLDSLELGSSISCRNFSRHD